jgi:mono/diheme cytochrome c family protein
MKPAEFGAHRRPRRSALAAGAVLAITIGVLLAGCASPRRSEPIAGPMVLSDPGLARGRALFDRHCYQCHLQGEGGMSPALNDKPLPRFLVRYQVRLGVGTMPAFGRDKLSDEELDRLADYVVYLRQHPAARIAKGG